MVGVLCVGGRGGWEVEALSGAQRVGVGSGVRLEVIFNRVGLGRGGSAMSTV